MLETVLRVAVMAGGGIVLAGVGLWVLRSWLLGSWFACTPVGLVIGGPIYMGAVEAYGGDPYSQTGWKFVLCVAFAEGVTCLIAMGPILYWQARNRA